ncbi:hypothetical protein WK07_20340 [Burkholderia multivorans]|nr:hypothetical protein WK07_20340 [Burkholderia multivorans]
MIAIDSQWGGGKTWFGRNWAAKLKQDGHKVAFIDAFEQDYTEDPFLPIAAELSNLLDPSNDEKKLAKMAAKVATVYLPVAAKMAMRFAAHKILGEFDVEKEIQDVADAAIKNAEEKSEEFVKQWVERRLENYLEERKSLDAFRSALTDMASKEKKPVVVFIDELDRCRPDFAVRLIERIKHFFETPNVVFVLLIHREQLSRAIAGVYGPSTDGAAYLSKFVHFFFTLPAAHNHHYIEIVLDRLGFPVDADGSVQEFANYFSEWQFLANLTMRDIERGCALFAYAQLKGAERLLAYLITMKLRRPYLFQRLLDDDRAVITDAKKWLNGMIAGKIRNKEDRVEFQGHMDELVALHTFTEEGKDVANRGSMRDHIRTLGSNVRGRAPMDVFRTYAQQIDLPIA